MADADDDDDWEAVLEGIRRYASEALVSLQTIIDNSPFAAEGEASYHNSWVRGGAVPRDSFVPSERCRFFDRHGFIRLPQFADMSAEVALMKQQMREMVQNEWNPASSSASVFRTDESQVAAQGSDTYFLDSATKVHFFTEQDATLDGGVLKPEYLQNKVAALNKAGHALHRMPGIFQRYTCSSKIRQLALDLGWIDPVVPQSMYIWKQPRLGANVVTSHQDSTFLYTTPRQTCLGLWLALDDATLTNGCLWVRPGSHKEPLRRKFVRNPKHFRCSSKGEMVDNTQPQVIFETLMTEEESHQVPWEGKIPGDEVVWEASSVMTSFRKSTHALLKAGFLPIECRAGDLLAFGGQLDHLSLPSVGSLEGRPIKERDTFQLHLVEGPKAGVEWATTNWLQYEPGQPFLSLCHS